MDLPTTTKKSNILKSIDGYYYMNIGSNLIQCVHQSAEWILKLRRHRKRLLASLYRWLIWQILSGRQCFNRLQVFQSFFRTFAWTKWFIFPNKKKAHFIKIISQTFISNNTNYNNKKITCVDQKLSNNKNNKSDHSYCTICDARAITSCPERSNFVLALLNSLPAEPPTPPTKATLLLAADDEAAAAAAACCWSYTNLPSGKFLLLYAMLDHDFLGLMCGPPAVTKCAGKYVVVVVIVDDCDVGAVVVVSLFTLLLHGAVVLILIKIKNTK